MIKAVIFDCFGVLVGKGFENTYRSAGGDPTRDRNFIDSTLNSANLGLISDQEFREAMAGKIGISVKDWRVAVETVELPNEELLAFIKNLRPKYKTAILSNANLGVLGRKIGVEHLKECFDEVIVSAEIGLVKPDPKIYTFTADKLGVAPEECVFVDDKQIFLDAANKLNMHVILYSDFDSFKNNLNSILN